jgi:hypothetical protein
MRQRQGMLSEGRGSSLRASGISISKYEIFKEKTMAATKQPKWDKQENTPIILADPDGPNRNPSFTEPLSVGQLATGIIGGLEIDVLLTGILSTTNAKGKIIRILDGHNDLNFTGDLSIGDTVSIDRDDMYSLDIDIENTP